MMYKVTTSQYLSMFWQAYELGTDRQKARYHLSGVYHFDEDHPVDVASLQQAIASLVAANINLRSDFIKEKAGLVQRIHSDIGAELAIVQISSEVEEQAQIEQATNRLFDLTQAPLCRFVLLQRQDCQRETLVCVFHHIIMDGKHFDATIAELFQYYETHETVSIDDTAAIEALENYLAVESERIAKADVDYWYQQVQDAPESIDLPYASKKIDKTQAKTQTRQYQLDAETYAALQTYSQRSSHSIFNIIKTAWALLISRYSRQSAVVISHPLLVAKDPLLKGCYINSNLYAYQEMGSFEDQLNAFVFDETLKQNRFAPILSVLENLYDQGYTQSAADLMRVGVTQTDLRQAPVDYVTAAVTPNVADSEIILEYELASAGMMFQVNILEGLLSEGLAEQVGAHFIYLLAQLLLEPSQETKAIGIVSSVERQQILNGFNQTYADYPRDKTLVDCFEMAVEQYADQVALVYQEQALTYRELDQRANQLAHYLQQQGAGPKQLVGILLDRGPEIVISMLAVLKTGAAYVPIDAAYPQERIQTILTDSNAVCLISMSDLTTNLSIQMPIVGVCDDKVQTLPNTPLDIEIQPKHLACLIYTSGSTGKPKGVMLTHQNLQNFSHWYQCDRGLQQGDAIAVHASYSFDAAIMGTYPVLFSGAIIHILPEALRLSLADIHHYFIENHIRGCFFTTQLGEQYMTHYDNAALKFLEVGGEKLKHYVPRSYRFINGYGPTETTVYASNFTVTQVYDNIPIGKPLANVQIVIVDPAGQLCPIGVAGELCIAGEGVGSGYYHQKEITEKAFVDNPFVMEGDSRIHKPILYKTGDLARWLPDGNLECLGRIDFQVKIRGYRIELGEIEAKLIAIDSINDGVVLALEDHQGNQFLCGYYSAASECDTGFISQALKVELPDYMVPDLWVYLESLPLTHNGKVNRKALPKPDMSTMQVEYCAPRTESEEILAQAFAQVLNIEQVGVYDDFFALGGNSLKAVALSAHLAEQGYEVKVADIFAAKTVEALAEQLHQGETFEAIQVAPKAKHYPTSLSQRNMFITDQLGNVSTTYNIPMRLDFKGAVDVVKLEQAIQALITRHDNFRTTFKLVDGEPVQTIKANMPFTLEQQKATKKTIDKLAIDFIQPFDLSQAPLFRFKLLTLSKTHHVLLFDIHHIVFDGGSDPVFMQELMQLYQGETLEPLTLQYKDFAVWQKAYRETEAYQEQIDYWLNEYAEEAPTLELPIDHPRSQNVDHHGQSIKQTLSLELSTALTQLASRLGISEYSLHLGAFAILLSKYCRQPDVVIGTAVAGRNRPEVQEMLGMFVNSLPIRQQVDCKNSVAEQLQYAHEKTLGLLKHQDYNIDILLETLGLSKNQGRMPLMDVFLNYLEADRDQHQTFQVEANQIDSGVAKFDLTLNCLSGPEGLSVSLEYRQSLFDAATIEQLLQHYQYLLKQIVANQQQTVSSLALLSQSERQHILVDFNQTQVRYSDHGGLLQWLDKVVQAYPQQIAVVFEERSVSYERLNQRANQLSHLLLEKGVTKGDIIGLCFEPCVDMVTAMLAVLKAGAAFLPMAADTPEQRIHYLLEDSNSQIVLTQSHLIKHFDHLKTGFVLGLDQWEHHNYPTTALPITTGPNDLAYVIYTSGSTGKPKGVLIEYASLENLIHWAIGTYQLKSGVACSKYASFAFDASIIEVFPSLLSGATLHIIPKRLRLNLEGLADYFQHNRIHYAFLPTPVAEHFMQYDLPALKHLNVAGDKLKQVKDAAYTIHNGYGPTENTVHSTDFIVTEPLANIPIGKPIANHRAYILDANLDPVPVGVAGELCMAGAGLARGYLNRDDLTAKAFIEHEGLGERIYRTGDLARWLPDGNIAFLGRIDHQVKIRGYRVELGEVEAALTKVASIEDAMVLALANNSDELYLCACYVSDGELDVALLEEALLERLPNYMVPEKFIHMNQFPVTVNGKVDRNKLISQVEALNESNQCEYIAPESDDEAFICKGMQQTLKLAEEVSVTADFFAIGGSSISVILLLTQLNQRFEVTIEQLYELRTPKAIAEHCVKRDVSEGHSVALLTKDNNVNQAPLTESQRLFLFASLLDNDSIAYNVSFPLKITGKLQSAKLMESIDKVVELHKTPQLKLHQASDGMFYQVVSDDIEKKVENASVDNIRSIYKEVTRPFNIYHNLCRINLVQVSEQEHYLFLSAHHVIFDGFSINVFLNDVFDLYFDKGKEQVLTSQPRFIDYAIAAEKEESFYKKQQRDLQFWVEKYRHLPSIEASLFEPDMTQESDGTIERLRIDIESDCLEKVDRVCHQLNLSRSSYLMAAYGYLLSRYNQDSQAITYNIFAGRSMLEQQNMLGMFATVLPILCQTGNQPIKDFLQGINSEILQASMHQEVAVSSICRELGIDKGKIVYKNVFNFVQDWEYDAEHLELSKLDWDTEERGYLFGLLVRNTPEKINLCFEYSKNNYRPSTVANIAKQYLLVVEQLSHLEESLSSLSLLSIEDYRRLISHNNICHARATDDTLISRFKRVATQYASRTAISSGQSAYDYAELDKLSDRLASYILGTNVKSEQKFVGFYLQRSINIAVCILGILKAGFAYIPIDPNAPKERVQFILEDSKPSLLIVDDQTIVDVNANTDDQLPPVFNINDVSKVSIDSQVLAQVEVDTQDAAYVIYTSGTTGKPKGVIQTHYNVLRLFLATQHWYQFSEKDTWTLFHSIAFDFSVWEFWGAILYGAKLLVVSEEQTKNPLAFRQLVESEQVSVLNQTPSAFYQFISADKNMGTDLPHLRYVIFGGEALVISNLKSWWDKYSDQTPRLVNMYGITETTVHVTYRALSKADLELQVSNIGTKIPDQTFYILDEQLKPVGLGMPGEIYIGGAGLSTGYLNRPQLTAERFIDNPFATEQERQLGFTRLYKTGDVAKWLPDGSIAYIGRNDHQIKLRGYRIELGEIESALLLIPDIEKVAVLLKTMADNQFLVAFYESGLTVSEDVLKQRLADQLPAYMIPSLFIKVAKMPLTINGKLNQHELLDMATFTSTVGFEAPRDEKEEMIVKAMSEVLQVERISIHDNFFDLGGNSILAMSLSFALQKRFSVQLKTIFEEKTPAQIAAKVEISVSATEKSVLEDIKQQYLQAVPDEPSLEAFKEKYWQTVDADISKYCLPSQANGIQGALITGATGFLGCHIVLDILIHTDDRIWLLVRGSSNQAARDRVIEKLNFYTNGQVTEQWLERISVFAADLTQKQLGLSIEDYQLLSQQTDYIINTAANVKHFGEYQTFYQDNVDSVRYLLDLVKHNQNKAIIFNHISTLSVGAIEVKDQQKSINYFTEFDHHDPDVVENYYVKTKMLAEELIFSEMKKGVQASICRVANLFSSQRYGRYQQNVENNGFYQRLKLYLNINAFPLDPRLSCFEFSPIDGTARAVVLLAKNAKPKQVFHLYNPHFYGLREFEWLFTQYNMSTFSTIEPFFEQLQQLSDTKLIQPLVEQYILHNGWAEGEMSHDNLQVENGMTMKLLDHLGFAWPKVQENMFQDLIDQALSEKWQLIEQLPFSRQLADADKKYMRNKLNYQVVRLEDSLKVGQSGQRRFYILLEGFVELSMLRSGWSNTLEILHQGDVLGIDAAQPESQLYQYMIAPMMGEAVLLEIDNQLLSEIQRQYPALFQVFFDYLLSAVERRNKQMYLLA